MKITSLLVSLQFFALPIYGQGLLEVLRSHGYERFARGLESHPLLLARVLERNDATVWAVPDKYVTSSWPEDYPDKKPYYEEPSHHEEDYDSHKKHYLFRRQTEGEYGAQMTHDGPPPEPMKRQLSSGNPPSNYVTLRTFVEDPSLTNLGKGQPMRIVRSFTDPPPGSDVANMQVTSGLGNIIPQIEPPIKYNSGIIVAVKNFFTLPYLLIETLTTVGLTQFRDEIISEGLDKELNKRAGITVFAPTNGSWEGDISVKKHVVSQFLYTQELLDKSPHTSDAGTEIKITQEDGIYYANGVRIVQHDIVIKNGVVHEIERPLDYKTKPEHKPEPKPEPKPKSDHKAKSKTTRKARRARF